MRKQCIGKDMPLKDDIADCIEAGLDAVTTKAGAGTFPASESTKKSGSR